MTTLNEMLDTFTPEQREEIERRVRELNVQHEILDQFRIALVYAHDVIAGQNSVSADHGPVPQVPNETILGLLHQCVEAMGGRYSLIVELPGRPPLALTDFEVADDEFHERGAVYHELTTLKDDWLDQARIPE